MVILTDNKVSQIELLYGNKVAKLTWLEQPDDQSFKEAFTAFLDVAKRYKIKSLISDNRKGITITVSLQRWTAEICASYLPELYVERYARIVSQDAFQQLVTYKIHDFLNSIIYNKVDLRVFTELETGMDWLLDDSMAETCCNIA